MRLASLRSSTLSIPFKASFKHASAERSATQSVWVESRAQDGPVGYGEGCPREYVTAESPSSAVAFVERHRADWVDTMRRVDDLADWVARHGAQIDCNPAAWTAVEVSLLDLMGKEGGQPIEDLLGVPRLSGRFRYTAVIGDSDGVQFERQVAAYRKAGFRDFKIKLSGERSRDSHKVRALTACGVTPRSVRADANNLWSSADAAIRDLGALDFRFFAIEEPIRAGDYDGLRRVAQALDTKVILDESLLRAGQLHALEGFAERCIVNLRVSKMGGLLRSLELVRELRRHRLELIVGAHVGETSVLTRAALAVANSARDCLVAQEGAFGTHLLARDITASPLMFGPEGILDLGADGVGSKPGLGLAITGPQ